MRLTFKTFSKWLNAVDESGAKSVKVTTSKHNTYYQARKSGKIIGYFNTSEGSGGKSTRATPFGQLSTEKELDANVRDSLVGFLRSKGYCITDSPSIVECESRYIIGELFVSKRELKRYMKSKQ